MDTRTFTLKEFTHELQVAGFLGAWKFWQQVLSYKNDIPVEENAERLLQAIAQICLKASGNAARSPEEEEAYLSCGFRPQRKWRN